MRMESTDCWRMPMWDEMMRLLPASVYVNLKTGSYRVCDNRMRCVYADDIDEEEVYDLIHEWSLLLETPCRGAFERALSRNAARHIYRDGSSENRFEGKLADGRDVRIQAVFAPYEKKLVAEFRFVEI